MRDFRTARRLASRDRFHRLAAHAPTSALRDCLLSIARLYDIDAGLVNESTIAIAESREALLRADAALRRRPSDPA